MGLVNPLAALIPLIETGGGEDANCRELIRGVKTRADADARAPAPGGRMATPRRQRPERYGAWLAGARSAQQADQPQQDDRP